MESKRIGPQMLRAAEVVANNPGCSIKYVAERITPCSAGWKNWGYGYDPVHRAIRAGLITARREGSRYVLGVPQREATP